jgi:hypothetical protein
VWRHRRDPYDLVVYQLGNAPCHDYMWDTSPPFPDSSCFTTRGCTTRAPRRLLKDRRFDDYRRELAFRPS